VLYKIGLGMRVPPLILNFKYLNEKKDERTFICMYGSLTKRQPSEANHDHARKGRLVESKVYPPYDDTGKFSFDKFPFYYMCFENKSEVPIEIQLTISFQYTNAEKAERRIANRARMGAAFRNRFGIGPPPLRTI
jgi:hypothetical protein